MFSGYYITCSTPRLHRLQPSPGDIHPPTRTRRQLLKRPQTRIQVIRLAARTSIHDLQIHTPDCTHFFIEPTRPQHFVAERVLIAVAARTTRGARGVKDDVRDRDDIVIVAAGLSAGAEAGAVVC
jgi:hypothetical protein